MSGECLKVAWKGSGWGGRGLYGVWKGSGRCMEGMYRAGYMEGV